MVLQLYDMVELFRDNFGDVGTFNVMRISNVLLAANTGIGTSDLLN